VFQELYHSSLKFSHFDERLFNYNLKGDISPIKRYPYKKENIKDIKSNTAYRALNFDSFKNYQETEVKIFDQPKTYFVRIFY